MSVTIVTGGGRGIGAATCRLLASRGQAVCVNYAASAEAAERVVRDIVAQGGKAVAFKADVADPAAVEAMFDFATEALGPVTGLVNNAGITGPNSRVDELDCDTLVRVLNVNVVGTFLCAAAAVRRMSTRHGGQGGAIVNVGSVAARLGSPGDLVHYAASKGAVESFTVGLAREVATEGVRVNCVHPGPIRTELHNALGGMPRLERMVANIPMRRPGEPEDVAAAIAFLLLDESAFVTGASLTVSGGR
jgi:NAD(P)-dependent dehydrogenase (short-subunit alcohol dehydrogenase family)